MTEGTLLDDRYRLVEILGRGGTAEVYRGTDELLGREVAVKVFDVRLSDLNSMDRQRTEMRVLSSLNHPNLVTVYDARLAGGTAEAGEDVDRAYLIMELVPGFTLADRLAQGPLSISETTRIGATLCEALAAVHDADLVHRDIKPPNVLMTGTGEIKLGDFGLARNLNAEQRVTTGADAMGTAAYFSPEQACAQEVGAPGDIYALGLVLLECLTGHQEFPGGALQSAVSRLLRDPVVPEDLPEPWPALLSAMTARAPHERPTAREVGLALGGGATQPLLTAASVPVTAPPPGGTLTPRGEGIDRPTMPLTVRPPSSPSSSPGLLRRRSPWLVLGGLVAGGGLALGILAGASDPAPGATVVPAAPVLTPSASTPSASTSAEPVTGSPPTPAPSTAQSSVPSTEPSVAPAAVSSAPVAEPPTSAAAPSSQDAPVVAEPAPVAVAPAGDPVVDADGDAPEVADQAPTPEPAPAPEPVAPVEPETANGGNSGGGNGNSGNGNAGGNGNSGGNGNGNGNGNAGGDGNAGGNGNGGGSKPKG